MLGYFSAFTAPSFQGFRDHRAPYCKGELGLHFQEFASGPMVRTQRTHSQRPGSIPGRVTKTQQAMPQGQKKKSLHLQFSTFQE